MILSRETMKNYSNTMYPSYLPKTFWNIFTALRLVFTSDGVEVEVVSRVMNATKSESEESERFHFLPTPLMTPSLTINQS